jgi:hypothetical protein
MNPILRSHCLPKPFFSDFSIEKLTFYDKLKNFTEYIQKCCFIWKMTFSSFTFFKTKMFLQFELWQKLLGPGLWWYAWKKFRFCYSVYWEIIHVVEFPGSFQPLPYRFLQRLYSKKNMVYRTQAGVDFNSPFLIVNSVVSYPSPLQTERGRLGKISPICWAHLYWSANFQNRFLLCKHKCREEGEKG